MIFAGIGHIIIRLVFYGYIILPKAILRYDLSIKSKKKMPYNTAFVFIDKLSETAVPAWAMKVSLE